MLTRCLPWWRSSSTCKPWQSGRFLPGAWERCQPLSRKGVDRTAGQGQQVVMQQEQALEDLEIPLARRAAETLFQEQPETGNPYLEDALLRSYLKTHLPPKVLEEVNQDLERFGNRLLTKIKHLGWECELNPPVFRQYDAWGRRVDHIVTCSAWRRMKEIAAEEGLIAEAYERRYSNWSRLHQAVKLYLFSSFSGGFGCPLAMTDGAAKVIESLGIPGSLKNPFDHLTSRDPKKFWTSGQWMTERRGGSDVGGDLKELLLKPKIGIDRYRSSHKAKMICSFLAANGTETVARKQPDGTYRLYGFKWFTSAADSDVALTLARVADAEGQVKQWPHGISNLSLFFLKVRDEEGKLNSIQVQRLKDKLGTRQMATAELWLDGAKAELISAEGRGVAAISNMLNITRIHNVIAAVAFMRRMISLSREYACRRVAFGKLLKDHPLHMQTIARMEVQTRGAFLLLMEIVRLLGLVETNMASEQDQLLLRLLTPVAKLYTGKQASAVVVEAMESFGGQGYMEDTGLPVIIRDTLVLSIWEGTTNILSLDVLRSLTKSQGQVMAVFFSTVQHLQKRNAGSAHFGILVRCKKCRYFHLSSEEFCIVRIPHDSQKRMVQLAQRRRVRVPPLSYTRRELEQINMLERKQELLLPRASSLKQLSSRSLSNAGEDGSKPSLIFQKIQWLGKKKLELASSTAKLEPAVKQMRDAVSGLAQFMQAAGSRGAETMELAARDFSYTLARIYAGALLIEHAARPDASAADISAAQRWCNQELCPVARALENSSYEAKEVLMDNALVYEGSPACGSRL